GIFENGEVDVEIPVDKTPASITRESSDTSADTSSARTSRFPDGIEVDEELLRDTSSTSGPALSVDACTSSTQGIFENGEVDVEIPVDKSPASITRELSDTSADTSSARTSRFPDGIEVDEQLLRDTSSTGGPALSVDAASTQGLLDVGEVNVEIPLDETPSSVTTESSDSSTSPLSPRTTSSTDARVADVGSSSSASRATSDTDKRTENVEWKEIEIGEVNVEMPLAAATAIPFLDASSAEPKAPVKNYDLDVLASPGKEKKEPRIAGDKLIPVRDTYT
ncbi:hypothetical protein GCK32_005765, partial [Trichostrongylus colubriformis]